MKSSYKSWSDVYRNAVSRGVDHGYAAYLADEWEKRILSSNKAKKKGNQPLEEPKKSDQLVEVEKR